MKTREQILEYCDTIFKRHKESFIMLGYYLCLVKDQKLFQPEYRSFADFTKAKYKLESAMSYNYCNVWKDFGLLKDNGDGKDPIPEVKPEFEEYSLTQLIQMLNATPEELSEINPSMSSREIKNHRKKEMKKTESFGPDPSTPQPDPENTDTSPSTDDYLKYHLIAEADDYHELIALAEKELPTLLGQHGNRKPHFTLNVAFEEIPDTSLLNVS